MLVCIRRGRDRKRPSLLGAVLAALAFSGCQTGPALQFNSSMATVSPPATVGAMAISDTGWRPAKSPASAGTGPAIVDPRKGGPNSDPTAEMLGVLPAGGPGQIVDQPFALTSLTEQPSAPVKLPEPQKGATPTPTPAPNAKPPVNSTPGPNTTTAPAQPPRVIESSELSDPSTMPMEDSTVISTSSYGPAVGLGTPYGVGPDGDALIDNISARIAGTYSHLDGDDTFGIVSLVELSKQIHDLPVFAHLGGGSEYNDGDAPIIFSAGLSHLATITGDSVVKPLILAGSYDGYYEHNFLGTTDDIYLDQVRALAGWAISPSKDVGVWGAVGLRSDSANRPAAGGGTVNIRGQLADRVAAYAACDMGRLPSRLMVSAGWEDLPGNFFAEADSWIPLKDAVNLVVGAGYSASGAWDGTAGVEFVIPAARYAPRTYRKTAPIVVADATGDCGDCGMCDICSTRYRGGLAYDIYRSALRPVSASRMRRWTDFRTTPNRRIRGNPIVPEPPENNCIMRWDNRPVVESDLSNWLKTHSLQEAILPIAVPNNLVLPWVKPMPSMP